jgi:hypothetical protein
MFHQLVTASLAGVFRGFNRGLLTSHDSVEAPSALSQYVAAGTTCCVSSDVDRPECIRALQHAADRDAFRHLVVGCSSTFPSIGASF